LTDKTVKLDELEIGDWAVITKVGSVGEIKRRLLEMGVLPGSQVMVERMAPLGDPIEVLIKGYHLSLRRTEASGIEVKKIEPPPGRGGPGRKRRRRRGGRG